MQWQQDKLIHAGAGALAAFAFAPAGLVAMLVAGVVAGLGKEAWDVYWWRRARIAGRTPTNTPDPWDFVATAAGGAAACAWSAVAASICAWLV